MILTRLVELAERTAGAQPPPMYQDQPIRWVVELDAAGRFLGFVDTADPSDKSTKRGKRTLAPHVKRAYGIKPKLLADTGVYVFGLPKEGERPERVAEQAASFKALVGDCATETGEPTVASVASFLDALDPAALELPPAFDPADTVTFRVDRVLPIDLPAVRAFWAKRTGAAGDTDDDAADALPCIACGRMRPAVKRHPLKIKGVPGGQPAGTDLISANSAAFESYGLENSHIAPTCGACAEAYANALNRLLADAASRMRTADAAYVFWTADPEADFDIATFIDAPTAEAVRNLMTAMLTASRGAPLVVDDSAFYALGLGAAGARVVVRSWLDTTVGAAKRRMARWFELQSMIERDGSEGNPVPLRALADATVRLNRMKRPLTRSDVPSKRTVDALIAFALEGTPLPDGVLFDAVRRCRADQGVTRERAMLIRMVVGSQAGTREGREEPMPELDLTNDDPAYLCGRLLAKLDALQRRALGQRNATVIDKFYGSASTAPASVFGLLFDNAQNHLAKLRKDKRTEAASRAIEADIQDIAARLPVFPHTLTLPQQGMFALGYYHQRAADAKAARERRASVEGDGADAPAA